MPRVVTPRVNPRFSTTRPAEPGELETVAVLLERVAAIVFEAVRDTVARVRRQVFRRAVRAVVGDFDVDAIGNLAECKASGLAAFRTDARAELRLLAVFAISDDAAEHRQECARRSIALTLHFCVALRAGLLVSYTANSAPPQRAQSQPAQPINRRSAVSLQRFERCERKKRAPAAARLAFTTLAAT